MPRKSDAGAELRDQSLPASYASQSIRFAGRQWIGGKKPDNEKNNKQANQFGPSTLSYCNPSMLYGP